MYNVTYVYIESSSNISAYSISDITISELKTQASINTRIYLSVESDNGDKCAIDFCRLVRDHSINVADDWDTFDTMLTDALVLGYTISLPAFEPGSVTPTNPVRIWDALSTLNTFNLDYSDYITGKYNIFSYRWMLKDLRMTIQSDAQTYPNLNRCLPIVNGFACRPVLDSNILYALDGAHLCWHEYKHITPEVQLLDFTEIGDISVVSIKDSSHASYNDVLVSWQGDSLCWSFSFSNYNLKEWTPIIVLCGLMILPDQYKVVSNNKLTVDINKLPLNKALALKQVLKEDPINNTNVVYKSTGCIEYIKEQFAEEVSADCFVVFIKTSRLYINRVGCDVWRSGISINLYIREGLLLSDTTNTVRNYHKEVLSNRKELTIQNTEVICLGDDSFEASQISFIEPDCKHHKFQDINKGRCTMVQLLGN